MDWLSLSNVLLSFDFDTQIESLDFDGDMNIAFSTADSVNFNFDANIGEMEDISLTVAVPLPDMETLFSKILNDAPPMSDLVSVTGEAEVTVSISNQLLFIK